MRLVVTSSFAALAALGAFRTVPAVPADVPADVPAQADAARGAFATRNFPAAPVPPAAYSAGAGSLRDARYHTPRADKVRGASASRYLPAAPVRLAASYPARTRSDGREIGAVLTTPAVETDYSAGQILTWPYQRASPAAVFSTAETNNDVGDLEAVFASFGLGKSGESSAVVVGSIPPGYDPQKDWDREPNLFPPCPFGTKAVPVSALPLPETLAYGRYYSEHRDFQRISDNLRTFVESAQHLIDSAVGHVESVNPWIAGKQTGITGDLPATRWKTIGYMQILVTNVVVKAVGFLGVRRHFLPNPNRKDTILLLKALLCGTSQLPKGPVGSALLSTSIWDLTDVSIVKLWPQVIDHISKLVDYVTISIVPFDRYKKWAADLKVNAAVLKGMLDNLHTGGHNAALARQQLLQNSYNDVGQSPGFPLVFGATPE
ncbi:MAG: hypothetical protein BJ554DRAFT_8001 [Olpidium bornovanus]|uniref:Uncharacterized protein n=1 Tax=Olpidium bornovanus TaxID=278681 RepID=A0A8H7ZVN7_9FUNG|nr:MAG: hypothetical protein BJ554DRAFT_8001 [Olpidium bornovanus]